MRVQVSIFHIRQCRTFLKFKLFAFDDAKQSKTDQRHNRRGTKDCGMWCKIRHIECCEGDMFNFSVSPRISNRCYGSCAHVAATILNRPHSSCSSNYIKSSSRQLQQQLYKGVVMAVAAVTI